MKRTILILVLVFAINTYTMSINVTLKRLASQKYEALSTQSGSSQVFLPIVFNGSSAYYVAPNGSDTNPGTFSQPWQTIEKAAETLIAGDSVYIRAGTYNEAVSFRSSGTPSRPIKILAFPGETPVIDGNHSIPEYGGSLLYLRGDYLYASGLEIRNSAYMGINVYGNYNVADNMYVHHSTGPGIFITHGHHSVVENSRIWRNGLSNENGEGSSSTGLSAARLGVSYATIRHNTSWENWGEGISAFEADQVTIEDNISHDNWSTNIYISDATNVLCQRNFVYMSPGSYIYVDGSYVGILLGDERYTPPSANITIINNIAYGNNMNLKWYLGVEGGGMNNVIISNNTFVNSMPNDTGGRNVDISSGTHQDVRFMNNIIVQDDTQPIEDITINPEVVLSNNLWSKSPRAAILGTDSIVGDPRLSRTGEPFITDWYLLLNDSPAISEALALAEVIVDYFGNPRDTNPDIGAAEYIP